MLRAVQGVIDDGIAHPVLLGRREVIARQIREMGLRMDLDESVQVLNPALDEAVFGPLFAQSVGPVAQIARTRNIPVIAFSTDANVASRGVGIAQAALDASVTSQGIAAPPISSAITFA